jgi:hypothetical protein
MKNAKKKSKKNRPPMQLKQTEKKIRALERPAHLVKAISESTSHFKTGRYES